ncbi:cellobiose 2-epimerase [Calothrix brevissima NIES-22]|nr:cellobiose 2-epimerase [Calothrix brevissima NIES-22]
MQPNRRKFCQLALISSLSSIFFPNIVNKAVAKPFISPKQNISFLPTAKRWLVHLNQDLLPFWTMESALGYPIGNFPSIRCNNGALLDRKNPCPEIKTFRNFNRLMLPRTYVVALSRQTYAYGVAFHLTGEPKYLEYAQAGVNYLRAQAFDRKNGGVYSYRDDEKNTWEPAVEYRNPQEQAYCLLGLSFYYYLTRDPEVLSDILAVKNYIFSNYNNSQLGTFQWVLKNGNNSTVTDKHLLAVLDQLNTYMVLLTPLLPEPEQSQWKQDMVMLSQMMLSHFYSAKDNLFFLRAENKSLETTDCDFGHTIKSMWMLQMIGLIVGDSQLEKFAEENGLLVLERAYLQQSGSWASQINKGGEINHDKQWWIYAELDQFAASLAVKKPAVTTYISQTYNYWFKYFVDSKYAEVWKGIDATTNQPKPDDLPKMRPWKNAYHSFEHALVGYITTQQIHHHPIVLYYQFNQLPQPQNIRPYFYTSTIKKLESLPNQIYKVTFTN